MNILASDITTDKANFDPTTKELKLFVLKSDALFKELIRIRRFFRDYVVEEYRLTPIDCCDYINSFPAEELNYFIG